LALAGATGDFGECAKVFREARKKRRPHSEEPFPRFGWLRARSRIVYIVICVSAFPRRACNFLGHGGLLLVDRLAIIHAKAAYRCSSAPCSYGRFVVMPSLHVSMFTSEDLLRMRAQPALNRFVHEMTPFALPTSTNDWTCVFRVALRFLHLHAFLVSLSEGSGIMCKG